MFGALTGLTGLWIGRRTRPGVVDNASGLDAHQLEWAHELCNESIDVLVRHSTGLFEVLNQHPEDRLLWSGVTRLARHVVDEPDLPRRKAIAANVIDHLDRLRPRDARELEAMREALQRIDWR